MTIRLKYYYTICLCICGICITHAFAQSDPDEQIRLKPVKLSIILDDGRKVEQYLVQVDSAGLYVTAQKKRVKAQLKNNCAECLYLRFDQVDMISTTKPNKAAGHIVGGCLAGTAVVLIAIASIDFDGGPGPSENVLIGSALMGYGLGYVIGSSASTKSDVLHDHNLHDRLYVISARYQFEVEKYKQKHGSDVYMAMVKDQKFNRFIRYEILVQGHGHMEGYIRGVDEASVYFLSAKNEDSMNHPDDLLLVQKIPITEILSIYIL